MEEEEKLTRRDALKGLAKLTGIVGFTASAIVTMGGALDNDIQRAEYNLGRISEKPKRVNYRTAGGLVGGAVSCLLIYYGVRGDKKEENQE